VVLSWLFWPDGKIEELVRALDKGKKGTSEVNLEISNGAVSGALFQQPLFRPPTMFQAEKKG